MTTSVGMHPPDLHPAVIVPFSVHFGIYYEGYDIMKSKRTLAALCAAVLCAGMTSCGSGTKTDESKAESKASTESAALTEEPPAAEENALPAEPFTTKCDGSAKVTVSGDKFLVGDKEIWFNGVNTPWDKWNDFGGNFSFAFWQEHFDKLHSAGVNACRIWISCNGDVGMLISPDGSFEGATTAHWEDLDTLFALAENYQIYIMATVQSFDHYKDTYETYESWRKLIQSPECTDQYVDNYIIPLVQRYDDCDYLWSVDLCNEPDWIVENKECGKLDWSYLQQYYAKASSAIHANSDVLVTVGMGMIKYNSDAQNGNKVSDEALQAADTGKYDNSLAYLDFWSTHWYDWMIPNWGVIYDYTPEGFGLDPAKPAVIGELPAKGKEGYDLVHVYENSKNNGFRGVFAWKSSGADDNCGLWMDCKPAIEHMMTLCPEMIFPNGKI